MIRLPKKQAMKAELKSGQKSVITFSSDSSRFYVNGKPVYENYYGNMWYRLRFELDTDSMTALVKLNGREIAQADFPNAPPQWIRYALRMPRILPYMWTPSAFTG